MTERLFLLFKMTRRSYWRPEARGYTVERAEAGRFPVHQALGYASEESIPIREAAAPERSVDCTVEACLRSLMEVPG